MKLIIAFASAFLMTPLVAMAANEKPIADFAMLSAIRDCTPVSGSKKVTESGVEWNLISRRCDATGKIYEVWMDSKSGLLWGDKLDSSYSQYEANKACGGDEGVKAGAGLDKKFILPTIDDFNTAREDGISEVLPNMRHVFWSSTVLSYYVEFAQLFEGSIGYTDVGFRADFSSVRCVSR